MNGLSELLIHAAVAGDKAAIARLMTLCSGSVGPIALICGGDEGLGRTQVLRGVIVRALAALTKPQRQILILRDLMGLSTSELAQRLDLTPAMIEDALTEARLALRDGLSARGQDAAPLRRLAHRGPIRA